MAQLKITSPDNSDERLFSEMMQCLPEDDVRMSGCLFDNGD